MLTGSINPETNAQSKNPEFHESNYKNFEFAFWENCTMRTNLPKTLDQLLFSKFY